MGTLTIRNLDDRVIDALKAQAKANQRSLEAEVRYVLGQEVNPRLRTAAFRERTAQLARETAYVPQTDSTELIRQDRERHEADSDATPTAPLFHTHIVVDWSAQSSPSPKKPSKDAIWWAVARIDGGDGAVAMAPPEYARTRDDAVQSLAGFIAGELDAGRRVLAGFDFPFGYPAGVAKHLTGEASALALWNWLAARIDDKEDNGNNRYAVAAAINATYRGVVGPCWGRPATWDYPTVPVKKSQRTCREPHPPERRTADLRAKGAKTVWQLAYAGSVGSQMLLGLPALKRLVADPRIRGRAEVWPFETGLRVPDVRCAGRDRRGLSLAAAERGPGAEGGGRNPRPRPGARERGRLRPAGLGRRSRAPLRGRSRSHARRTQADRGGGGLDPRPRPRRGAQARAPAVLRRVALGTEISASDCDHARRSSNAPPPAPQRIDGYANLNWTPL